MNNNYILPNWPAPKNVKAYTTKRLGGISKAPYDSFNFSLFTGDDPGAVLSNRQKLCQELNLPQQPFWLKQEHTNIVIQLKNENIVPSSTTIATPSLTIKSHSTQPALVVADASFTAAAGPVCAVMTADCIPILICDTYGTIVAAIHAGWKGIASGIIATTIKAMNTDPETLLAWLGPAIGPTAFVVNQEVYAIFCNQWPENKLAFAPQQNSWLANIYLLATNYLQHTGINKIYGGKYCTFTQKDLFFSYRRDGEKTGRIASIIWLNE